MRQSLPGLYNCLLMGDVSLSEAGNCFKEHFLLSDPSVHRNRQECLEGCLRFPGEQLLG